MFIQTPSGDNAEKMRKDGNIHPGLFTRREAGRFLAMLDVLEVNARTAYHRGHETTIHICITQDGREHWINGEDGLFAFMCHKTGIYKEFLKMHWNTPI